MGTVCPQGHDSASSDFCDVCGTRISSSPSRPDGMTGKHHAPGRFVASGGETCPRCGAAVIGQFCEACGFRVSARRPFAPLGASGGALLPLPPPKRARCHRPARRRPARHRPARPNRCSRRFQARAALFGLEPAEAAAFPAQPAAQPSTAPGGQPPGRRSEAVDVPEAPETPDEPSGGRSVRIGCSRRPPGPVARSGLTAPRRPHRRPAPGRLRRPPPRRSPARAADRRPRRPGPRPRRPRPQPRRRRPYPPSPGSPGPCWLPRTASTTTGCRRRARVFGSAVEFPAHTSERRIRLVGKQMRIGRRSAARDLVPEIDLADQPVDPGVSRLHAVLDLTHRTAPGSSATPDRPTAPSSTAASSRSGKAVTLHEGDRINLGAWTVITVHRG